VRSVHRLTFTLVVATCLQAQSLPTWNVRGKVTRPSGEPVAKAAVKLKSESLIQARSFITTSEGKYMFRGLNPHVDYTVQARNENGRSPVRRLSKFAAKEDHVVDLTLTPRKAPRPPRGKK